MTDAVEAALAAIVREEWGRLTSLLLARFRRLDLVEDALADAVERAAQRWPRDGVPDNPSAWVHTVARRRVLDRVRAEAMQQRKMPLLVVERHQTEPAVRADPGDLIEDDLLRLVLMCSHPALDPAAASALTLRLVLGVRTADVARLFLVTESTMAARLTRAKKKIISAGIPFSIPISDEIPDRLAVVAQTAYLAFTAGYAPGSGPDALRVELAGEAIRLVRVVLALRPTEPVLVALLSLMLLQHSRRDARVDAAGSIVLLPDQARERWHHDEIAEALELLRSPSLVGPIPRQAAIYVVQAQIAAEHACAATASETNWRQVVEHYDRLLALQSGPSARLARAVAVGEAFGPPAGLDALAGLDADLPHSHRVPTVRAVLLTQAGEYEAARIAYDLAIERCDNDAERHTLLQRRAALDSARLRF
ncbi:RNA polymerase sigma factor [Demetria terragena]|uniref:RNA polymerase sigma factor n=1 Tax=Demetria terragena TaxID=63959 RepID=UPI000380C638|nr:DUF6596 domain-containing protein [Demetria terragena]